MNRAPIMHEEANPPAEAENSRGQQLATRKLSALHERRILILAPTANDGRLAAAILQKAGMSANACQDMQDLCQKLQEGCGVIFLAEEALVKESVSRLAEALLRQPSWSNVPIVLVTGTSGPSQHRLRRLHSLGPTGNVTVIERPFHPGTLISNIDVALSSRQRQYQVRDLLDESFERERRLSFTLRAGNLGAWQLDWELRSLSASGVARENLGLPAMEKVSALDDIVNRIHLEDRDHFINALDESICTQSDFGAEFRLTDAQGRNRWIDMRGRIVTDAPLGITRLSGVTQDITERKRTEQALRASEERFRKMSDSAPVMIWLSDVQQKALWFNQAWLEFVGRPMGRELGSGWTENIHPEDAASCLKVSTSSVTARKSFKVEYRHRRYDGSWRWLLNHGTPLYGPGDEFEGYIGSCIDITERRETTAELENLVNERTATLQKTIGDLEAFSYTVSHDLRAPIRAIQSYAVILQDDYPGKVLDGQGLEFLKRIAKAGARMDHLILDVLAYSKMSRDSIRMHSVKLKPLIEDILQQYPRFNAHDVNLEIPDPNLAVTGSEPLLTQCLSNLVGNAIKFSRPEQDTRVSIHVAEIGDRVRLLVEDNGIGIPAEHHARIFGMFERLDPTTYEGTGVGLAIVQKAVERMAGSMGLDSKPGRGSRFWIDLARG